MYMDHVKVMVVKVALSVYFNRLIVEGQALTVYGDGEQTRDFIYVDDVVDANIKAMGNSQCTGIYNVSTNKGTSVE